MQAADTLLPVFISCASTTPIFIITVHHDLYTLLQQRADRQNMQKNSIILLTRARQQQFKMNTTLHCIGLYIV